MNTEQVKKEISSLFHENQGSGVVLLSGNAGETVFSLCHGLASMDYGIKNERDTKFNIASVGKAITGVAIAQLIQKQLIDPAETVARYIELDNPIFKTITVQQLLTHTSGLGDYFEQANHSSRAVFYEELEDYKDIIRQAKVAFTPGEKWAYSNLGYLVLGLIIEKITRMRYEAYITQNIFAPARMTHSGFWLYNEPVYNRAVGYEYDEERHIWKSRASMAVLRGTSAGGWFSTVGDLAGFMNALIGGRLTDPATAKQVTTPKPAINAPFYGYGFYVSEEKISHGGNAVGYCAGLTYYKKSGYTLAVLCNRSYGADKVEEIFDRILL